MSFYSIVVVSRVVAATAAAAAAVKTNEDDGGAGVVLLRYGVMDMRKNAARLWLAIELGRVTDAQCGLPVPWNAAGAESARGRVRGAGAPPGRRLERRGSLPPLNDTRGPAKSWRRR